MSLRYDSRLKPFAQKLRRSMTLAERKLWYRINRKQLAGKQFYRQKPLGPYVVDFYCPKAKLVIELDGGQHYSPAGTAKDRERDAYLADLGLKVLRFSDRDVLCQIEEVVSAIYNALR
jgi:very-short-patch-repair endonuclease